ncbi:MAG: DMT family transporter [Rhizobiaceae bacterium]|nr:DMT family transporter [Rhizobiaceae bacterium]
MNTKHNGAENSRVLLGVVLMVVAMLTIPFIDGGAKYLSEEMSPLFISWARYAAASLIILPILLLKFGSNFLPKTHLKAHFLRTIFLVTAMTCYFIAIAQIPMATALSAYFVGPIIATLLAVFILGEKLTIRKIISLLLGFSGTLLILRPGGEFEPGLLFAMASGLFFALYLIATKQASHSSDPIKTLTFQCLVGMLLLSPQAIWAWSIPSTDQLMILLVMGVLSTFGHLLSIMAFQHAEASILAPLVYVELIGTTAVGFIFFNEFPEPIVWLGAAIIIASGLLLVLQRRQ